MCYYLAAALPKEVNLSKLRQICSSHAVALKALANPDLANIIPKGDQAFLTTTGDCDCATSIGGVRRKKSQLEISSGEIEKKAAEHRKNGWSATKIERWLNQHQSVEQKNERLVSLRATGLQPDALRWHQCISQSLREGNISSFGLMLHWYRGFPEAEQFSSIKTVSLSVNTLEPEDLLELEDDILYRFLR